MHALKTKTAEPEAFLLHLPSTSSQSADDAFQEIQSLGKGAVDTTFLNTRRHRVMNKLARYNFNIGDRHQDPDIPNGKNTLYTFDEMPCAKRLRSCFDLLADKIEFATNEVVAGRSKSLLQRHLRYTLSWRRRATGFTGHRC